MVPNGWGWTNCWGATELLQDAYEIHVWIKKNFLFLRRILTNSHGIHKVMRIDQSQLGLVPLKVML